MFLFVNNDWLVCPHHEVAFGGARTRFSCEEKKKKNDQDQNSFAWQNNPPTQKHVLPLQEF